MVLLFKTFYTVRQPGQFPKRQESNSTVNKSKYACTVIYFILNMVNSMLYLLGQIIVQNIKEKQSRDFDKVSHKQRHKTLIFTKI